MIDSGMTQQEIADETYRRTGQRVTRAAVSAAMARAGMPPRRGRYNELIPWTVKVEHGNHYACRMLRAESRLRAGLPLPDAELRRLRNWRQLLSDNGAVVHYDPDTRQGFFYVDARKGIDMDLIRRPDVEVA
jgi:hypothetical protein